MKIDLLSPAGAFSLALTWVLLLSVNMLFFRDFLFSLGFSFLVWSFGVCIVLFSNWLQTGDLT